MRSILSRGHQNPEKESLEKVEDISETEENPNNSLPILPEQAEMSFEVPAWVPEAFMKAAKVLAVAAECSDVLPPKLRVRFEAALLSLERISRINESERCAVFDIIQSYIHLRVIKREIEEMIPERLKKWSWGEFSYEFQLPEYEDIDSAIRTLGVSTPTQRGLIDRYDAKGREDPFTLDLYKLALQRTKMNGLNLDGASAFRCNLAGSEYAGALMRKVNFYDCNLMFASFSRAVVEGAWFHNCTAHGAIFTEANLTNTSFLRASLVGASFNQANLRNTTFSGTCLRDAEFCFVKDATEANFANADLSGILLQPDVEDNAIFSGARFRGAGFKGACLQNIDLRNVTGITEAQLQEAFGDASVILSDDIRRPEHWPSMELRDMITDAWRVWQKTVGYAPTANPISGLKLTSAFG